MAPSSPAEGTLSRGWPAVRHPFTMGSMTGLAVILLIVGIVLLLLGVFIEAAKFLLWIGLVIIVIAVIAWLMRFIRRQT